VLLDEEGFCIVRFVLKDCSKMEKEENEKAQKNYKVYE
jgi:hypothetical protein